MNRDEFLQLLSKEGQSLLAQIDYSTKLDIVKTITKLRAQGHDPALIANALSQAKLRKRAEAKFGEFAQRMFFTEDALEQASRLQVAALHANRFKQAGVTQVADLGCGIGAESLAFASLDLKVSAYEIDEVTSAIAAYNLAIFDNVEVNSQDVTKLDLEQHQALFFDPARRNSKARLFNPQDFAPNFDWVIEQAKKKPSGIKLGPGHPHNQIPQEAEAQWVSVEGDLVELSLWFNETKRQDVTRSALLITKDGKHELKTNQKKEPAPTGELGQYIHEPDNAVIRSHLINLLAEQTNTHTIDPQIAYLTGNDNITSPWLKSYKITQVLPFDRKQLKAYIKQNDIGTLEIKKRGADITPEELRKELAPKGKNKATLIVTRIGDAHRAIFS
ncbi:MAG: class I SAM-dependent methyltransferase [Rhodoluna sp.]|nr:class I SAM-dependent methyltransferase [Rhodoluna sp.]